MVGASGLMAYEVASYPLALGIQQGTDRTMLPPGTLIEATGVRRRKGGIGKANGLTNAGVTAHAGDFSGPCDALGYAAGRQVCVMNGQTWARKDIGDTWVEVGRASRARPVRAHWEAFTDATSGAIHSSIASIGDYIATAHYDGVGVRFYAQDEAGIRRAAAFFSGYMRPRLVAVGTTLVLVMKKISNGDVYAATIDGTTLAVSAATFLIAAVSSDDVFDAAPFNSTVFLLATRNAATTFQVAFVDTSLALGAYQQVTCNSAGMFSCSVYGTDGEGIWATFDDQIAQKIISFTEDLSAAIGSPTSFAGSTLVLPAVMTRRSSTTVWVVWSEISNSPTRYLMRVAAFDTTHTLSGGAVGYAWHVRPASRPWSGSTGALNIWLHTDNGTAPWRTQRRYTLATLVMDLDTPDSFGMFVEPELSPDERANEQQSFHLPECVFRSYTDEVGTSTQRGFFPALATIRTQNDDAAGTAALLLYEWETDAGFSGRARQVAEVGGQGVVFGGGLQEIPSARIAEASINDRARGVENGFLYSPAILSATKTATGADGLTADALYQFVAVYEYVTPDGLRVRSAPSAIATETPTAGNLNVELKIATAPTTEREFSSPPNGTVVHIYATVGNGSTFQRITPDSGLGAARGSTTVGIVTYVHSVADSTVEDNEPSYTEVGTPPQPANEPAPAHRFGWVGGGYAWVGGLFNPALIERSKPPVPNEPVQFTRQNTHRCLLPEACTGGAWMDGLSIAFTLTGIYLVAEALGAPQRHPSPVGCIDYRSIVETRDGIGFQSRRGYELLPRGFGQPILLSSPIEDSLRGRLVISATVTGHSGSTFAQAERGGESLLVLFAIDPTLSEDPGVRLVYDLDAGRWVSVDPAMSDSGAIGEVLTNWNGRLVVASRSGTTIRYESPTDWGVTEAVPVSITLADLRPFDVLRRGQIARVLVLGEIRSTTAITLTAYVDGIYSKPLPFETPRQLARGTKGDKFILSWQLPIRQANALTLKLDCADPTGTTPGEGVVIHAVGIDAEGLPGRPRIAQERQAA